MISHCDPASGVTTLALLAGSRNTTATRSQLSIRAGRDCVGERLLYDSVFAELNILVSAGRNYAETKFRVTAVTETRPKPKNLAVSAPKPKPSFGRTLVETR